MREIPIGEPAISRVGKRIVLLVCCMASSLTPFLWAAMNVAIPVIGSEFNEDAITLGWVVISFLLSAAIFIVPFGKIPDTYVRSRLFIAPVPAVYTGHVRHDEAHRPDVKPWGSDAHVLRVRGQGPDHSGTERASYGKHFDRVHSVHRPVPPRV